MATDNNIKNFTATDIEKYHKGLLSSKERHDLEKAALDDPFLADALEGYTAGINVTADIAELRDRLKEKTGTAKVIPMKRGGKTSFPWLRVAALLIVLAGLGLLANQFLFNNKKSGSIAKLEETKKIQSKTTDSVTGNASTKENPSATTTGNTVSSKPGQQQTERKTDEKISLTEREQKSAVNNPSKGNEPGNGAVTVTSKMNPENVSVPAKTNDKEKGKPSEKIETTKEITKEESKAVVTINKDADGVADKLDGQQAEGLKKKNAVAANRKMDEERVNVNGYSNQSNTFRGRVTDANNVGLPFARVYNPNDNNAGTYTDVAGNFNLTFPDSVLNVQVRSVGFENATVQLRSNTASNQVIMQDDRKSLSEVVVSNQKPNAAARSMTNNMKLEEPEPVDGWPNYDTYLANNLDIPEEIKTKPNASGQVQVSFEVNKEGEPVKFKIEKSLCGKCDKEAIRLIKQGPKWKRTANKNGRTVVTINF